MAKANVYKNRKDSGRIGSRNETRNAKPLRAQFVFADGFTVKDKDGKAVTLANRPDASVYTFDFPFGPKDLKYDQFSPKFQELSRPFKKPLLVSESAALRTLSFNAVIADKESGGKLSIIALLGRLEEIAESGVVFQFKYGLTALPFSVVMTKFSYSVSYRMLDGSPSRAEVSIQLTESVFANQDLTVLKAVYRDPILVSPNISSPTPTPDATPVDDPPPRVIWVRPTTGWAYDPAAEGANYILQRI